MGVQIPSGGPKNKKHPLRCFLFLYTKKTKGFEADRKKSCGEFVLTHKV